MKNGFLYTRYVSFNITKNNFEFPFILSFSLLLGSLYILVFFLCIWLLLRYSINRQQVIFFLLL